MSYKINFYTSSWEFKEEISLNEDMFNDANINNILLHEFIVLQMANARVPRADTQVRSEVRCSWKKLYRQKWTWRARVWSADSWIRKWGWVYFWPKKEVNYKKDMPKKKRKKAVKAALSLKAREWNIFGLSEFWAENVSTKHANGILKKLSLDNNKVLLVLNEDDTLEKLSFRNIENVKYVNSSYINPYDLLTHEIVLFYWTSLQNVEKVFA